jgi:hypothetical protein
LGYRGYRRPRLPSDRHFMYTCILHHTAGPTSK